MRADKLASIMREGFEQAAECRSSSPEREALSWISGALAHYAKEGDRQAKEVLRGIFALLPHLDEGEAE